MRHHYYHYHYHHYYESGAAFRSWLVRRYGTVGSLNGAWGTRCMDLMLSGIEDGESVGTTVVEPELVVRESTSAPA